MPTVHRSAPSPTTPPVRVESELGHVPGVQSIVRAFAILETVARSPEGIGLSELARKVGLHSSTTFNLVRTMTSLGYLAQSHGDKRYRIGRALLSFGATAVDDLLLVDKAKAVMEDLSRSSGETGTFAVWTGDRVIALARSSGAGAFQLSDRVGGTRPAHATATGKVLLAALPPEQLDAHLDCAKLARFTPRTIVEPKRLRSELARIRSSGIAVDNAEYHDDVCCIAVPVRDFSGRTVGAMGLSGPIWRMTEDVLPKKADMLRKAAERLSQELGSGGLTEAYSPAVSWMQATTPGAERARPPRAALPGPRAADAETRGSSPLPRRRPAAGKQRGG